MTKYSRTITVLIILTLLSISFVGFRSFSNSTGKKSSSKQTSTQKKDDSSVGVETKQASDEFASAVSDNSAVDENDANSDDHYLDVSKTDCANSCQNFTDPDDLKYCQATCNLSPADPDIKTLANCSNLKKLEKDYCLKDLATNTKNSKTCEQISDGNIQKACQKSISQ